MRGDPTGAPEVGSGLLPRFGEDRDSARKQGSGPALKGMMLAEAPLSAEVDPFTLRWLDAWRWPTNRQAAFPGAQRTWTMADPRPIRRFFAVFHAITVHISGDEAFASLGRELAACVDEQAIKMMACWDFHEFNWISPGVTIGAALLAAAERGAKVRALFNHIPVYHLPVRGEWRPMPVNNRDRVGFVNNLPGGVAIHDAQVLHRSAISFGLPLPGLKFQVGSHHQKAWAVWTGERLTAWCWRHRRPSSQQGPQGFHDIQVELAGIAAAHLYEILRKRSQDRPDRPAGAALPALAPTPARGTQRCRVLTTYGNPTQFAGLNTAPYAFAPQGSKAIRQMLFRLIGKARDFIYLEDQCFVDERSGARLPPVCPNSNADHRAV